MSGKLAIWLGAIIVLLSAADIVLNDAAALVFLGRKLLDLTEYLAFWR